MTHIISWFIGFLFGYCFCWIVKRASLLKLQHRYNNLKLNSKVVVDFCYPEGKWRGWANMKGLLETIQPLVYLLRKN